MRASDNGIPPKIITMKLNIEVVNLPDSTTSPPHVKNNFLNAKITESEKIGHLVTQIQAYDENNDTLWYEIIGKYFEETLNLFIVMNFLNAQIYFKRWRSSESFFHRSRIGKCDLNQKSLLGKTKAF